MEEPIPVRDIMKNESILTEIPIFHNEDAIAVQAGIMDDTKVIDTPSTYGEEPTSRQQKEERNHDTVADNMSVFKDERSTAEEEEAITEPTVASVPAPTNEDTNPTQDAENMVPMNDAVVAQNEVPTTVPEEVKGEPNMVDVLVVHDDEPIPTQEDSEMEARAVQNSETIPTREDAEIEPSVVAAPAIRDNEPTTEQEDTSIISVPANSNEESISTQNSTQKGVEATTASTIPQAVANVEPTPAQEPTSMPSISAISNEETSATQRVVEIEAPAVIVPPVAHNSEPVSTRGGFNNEHDMAKIPFIRSRNYKRNGTKSYVYLLNKFRFEPTRPGPYVLENRFNQRGLAGFGAPVGGRLHINKVLVKKPVSGSGENLELTELDHQTESMYLVEVGIGSPPQRFVMEFDSASSDTWV
jgi:hypothetical protein